MAIRVGESKGPISDMNVTPLVDVMLVLLVVFIVTAPLLTPQALNVHLPTTKAVAGPDSNKTNQLAITAAGQLELNGNAISKEEFVIQLKQIAQNPKSQLQIAADQMVPYGRVAEVMALAQAEGVVRLSFLTQSKSGNK